MLITVPSASSSTLDSILSNAQRLQVVGSREGSYQVIIQNLGSYDIYYDFNSSVTPSTGVKIQAGSTTSLVTQNISLINLISETSDNTNVRVASK